MTLNAVPPCCSPDGVAAPAAERPLTTKRLPLGVSRIFVRFHAPSLTDPRWPLALCAQAPLNPAEPKLASGSVWQDIPEMQSEGASTIHSAEETSRLDA